MQKILEKHNEVKSLIERINLITFNASSGKIIFFKDVTIQVTYLSSGGCYGELVSWFYALFIEVCGPNIKFFDDRLNILGLITNPIIGQTPKIVHAIRTVNNHNMDLSDHENMKKIKFSEDWYMSIVQKTKPETDQEYTLCSERLLVIAIEYLKCLIEGLELTIKDEFFADLLYPEWQRRNDRDYGVHDFEKVFVEQLELFGMRPYLDVNKIVKREISKWKEDLKILKDGFDFRVEAATIIQRYIIDSNYSPVDIKDLIDLTGKKGNELREAYIVIREEFNRDPRSQDELLSWAQVNGVI